MSPRFWEITNFLHKGGGLSLFYRSSCRYQFDKVQSVCILTNACNFNERQELVLDDEMSLYMYSLWIAFATSLRKIYTLVYTYWSLSVSSWENRKELIGQDLYTQEQANKNICLAANSAESIVNCRKL